MADAKSRSLAKDDDGAVLIEATASILVLLSLVFGIVEFSYLFQQWNAAAKAVQIGARTAAVSDPVVNELAKLDGLGNALPGKPYATADQFSLTCSGSAAKCTCIEGCGSQVLTYNSTAMNRVVTAMQRVFPRLKVSNVEVKYQYTKLGYAGRPGGPVPTITVSITGVPFTFVLLSAFLPDDSITMPTFTTTVTGEDLSQASSS